MKPLVVDLPECSRLAGIQKTKIYDLFKIGALEKVKIGRRTFVTLVSIEGLIAQSKVGPA